MLSGVTRGAPRCTLSSPVPLAATGSGVLVGAIRPALQPVPLALLVLLGFLVVPLVVLLLVPIVLLGLGLGLLLVLVFFVLLGLVVLVLLLASVGRAAVLVLARIGSG